MKIFKDNKFWKVHSESLNIKTVGVTKLKALEKFAKRMQSAIKNRTAPKMLKRIIESIKK